MKRIVYQLHLFLGILVSVPVLAWSISGFLYALPNTVEGGTVEKIDAARVKIAPAGAMAKANELSGKTLPTTALTLLMKDGRPQYQSIGGLGADSIFIDAETGVASFSQPPTLKTRFFREAHFYFFAGSWQVLFSWCSRVSPPSRRSRGSTSTFHTGADVFVRKAARNGIQSDDNFCVAQNHRKG